jgi:hypothetical protein
MDGWIEAERLVVNLRLGMAEVTNTPIDHGRNRRPGPPTGAPPRTTPEAEQGEVHLASIEYAEG